MVEYFYYFFAALTLISALLVVVCRNTVNSALFMILSFLGMAGLFLMLEAFFLAILQVLVYAGAVMVLFLFVIMLLDVEATEKSRPTWVTLLASLVAFVALAMGALYVFYEPDSAKLFVQQLPEVQTMPTDAAPMAFTTSVRSFGYGLFSKYMLPFQLAGFLLLVAVIGIILISKRSLHSDNNNKKQ